MYATVYVLCVCCQSYVRVHLAGMDIVSHIDLRRRGRLHRALSSVSLHACMVKLFHRPDQLSFQTHMHVSTSIHHDH